MAAAAHRRGSSSRVLARWCGPAEGGWGTGCGLDGQHGSWGHTSGRWQGYRSQHGYRVIWCAQSEELHGPSGQHDTAARSEPLELRPWMAIPNRGVPVLIIVTSLALHLAWTQLKGECRARARSGGQCSALQHAQCIGSRVEIACAPICPGGAAAAAAATAAVAAAAAGWLPTRAHPCRPLRRRRSQASAMEGVQQQVGEVREQLAGAIDVVLADMRQKWRELSGGPGVTEGLQRFVAAVDWSVSAPRRLPKRSRAPGGARVLITLRGATERPATAPPLGPPLPPPMPPPPADSHHPGAVDPGPSGLPPAAAHPGGGAAPRARLPLWGLHGHW